MILASVYRFGEIKIYDFVPSLNILSLLLILNVVIVYMVFFVDEKTFDIEKTVKFVKIGLVVNMVFTSIALVLFLANEEIYSDYEDIFIIENVIMNYTMCFYVVTQYMTWPNQKKHYMLERFIKDADNEEELLESLAESDGNEQKLNVQLNI